MSRRDFHILYVDTGSPQAKVTAELLNGRGKRLLQVSSGAEALACLRGQGLHRDQRRPDLVLVNLPARECQSMLAELKGDESLRSIPVVVMGPAINRADILQAYDSFANCYVTSPATLDDSRRVLHALEEFWFSVAKLPGP